MQGLILLIMIYIEKQKQKKNFNKKTYMLSNTCMHCIQHYRQWNANEYV
jgi:hypothetical protein